MGQRAGLERKTDALLKVAQSCPTLCDPKDYTVHGILQAGMLEWLAFLFSRDLPNPGIEPRSPALQADSLPTELSAKPEIRQSSFYFTLCFSERQWCPCIQNQCSHTASRMSARAIESGEGDALGTLLPELLSEGECPWEISRGRVARRLGFLDVGSRGLGSDLVPIKSLSPGLQPPALCSQDPQLSTGAGLLPGSPPSTLDTSQLSFL